MSSKEAQPTTADTTSDTPAKKNSAGRFLLRSAQGLVVILLFITLSISALLGLQSSRLWLAESAIAQLNDRPNGPEFKLQGLQTPSLGHWLFDRLEITEQEQQQLLIEQFEIEIDLFAIFDHQIHIKQLSSQLIRFNEIANNKETDEPVEENTPFQLPTFPKSLQWQLLLDKLLFERLSLKLLSLTELPDFRIEGKVSSQPSLPFSSQLELLSLTEAGEEASIRPISLNLDTTLVDQKLSLNGALQEPYLAGLPGLLSNALQLPEKSPLDWQFALNLTTVDELLKLTVERSALPFLAHQLNLQGVIETDSQLKQFKLNELILSTDQQAHQISGFYSDEKIELALNLEKLPLDLLRPWVEQIDSGTLSSKTTISGSPTAPKIDTQSTIHLKGQYQELPLVADLNIAATTEHEKIKIGSLLLKLCASCAVEEQPMRLKVSGDYQLNNQEAHLKADLTGVISPTINRILTTLEIDTPELLAPLNYQIPTLKLELNGPIEDTMSQAHMAVHLAVVGDYQQQPLTLDLQGEGNLKSFKLNNAAIQLASSSIKAQGVVQPEGENNQLKLVINPLRLADIQALKLPLPESINSLNGQLTGDLQLKGNLSQPNSQFNLNADLNYPLPNSQGVLRNTPISLQLQGRSQQQIVYLSQLIAELPAGQQRNAITFSATGQADLSTPLPAASLTFSPLTLSSGWLTAWGWPDPNGTLTLEGKLRSAASQELNLAWLNKLSIDSQLNYQSELSDSLLAGSTDNKTTEPAKKITWNAALSHPAKPNQPLKLISQITQGDQQADLNLQLSMNNLWSALNSSKAKIPKLDIQSKMNLEALAFILPPGQKLVGLLSADLSVQGDIEQPQVNGNLLLDKGLYEHQSLGVQLQNIKAQLLAKGQTLEIATVEATDIAEGKIVIKGNIDWQHPDSENALAINLIAENFNLVQRNDISGQMDANITANGKLLSPLIKGAINLSPLLISLDAPFSSSVPSIEYQFDDQIEQPKVTTGPQPKLDISVNIDQQGYIRGRGVDAELKGSIALKGPVNDLKYNGTFKTLRGKFEVLGKPFNLEQGEVGFSNSAAIILINGVHTQGDYQIQASLQGQADDLKLKLSSTPELPEDEVFSQLIFGRSIQNISTLQAIQLASAVQSLRGGSSFNPLGTTRELLGVDSLNVDSADGKTSVSAGKYLSDNVYLELNRSSDPVAPWNGTITIELTPDVTLESSTGGRAAGSGVELLWEKDF